MKLTIPIVPSLNHCYRNVSIHRRILTPVGAAWRDEVQWLVRSEAKRQNWRCASKEKVILDYWIFWPDYRKRDPDNQLKLLLDTLTGCGAVWDDDRWVLPRCQDFSVDKHNPRVEVEIRRVVNADHPSVPPQNKPNATR